MHVYIWYGNVWFRYVRVYILHGHETEKRGTELLNWWNEPGVFKLYPRNHVDHLRCLHVCNHLFQRHQGGLVGTCERLPWIWTLLLVNRCHFNWIKLQCITRFFYLLPSILMQPQIVREASGSGCSPGNDILLEETSELPKSIGRRYGLVDFMSNLDVSHVGARRSRIKHQGIV